MNSDHADVLFGCVEAIVATGGCTEGMLGCGTKPVSGGWIVGNALLLCVLIGYA